MLFGLRQRQVPDRRDPSGHELSQAHCLNKGGPIITRPPPLTALVVRNDDSHLTAWCCIPGQEVVAHPAVDVIMLTDGTEQPPVGGDEKVRAR